MYLLSNILTLCVCYLLFNIVPVQGHGMMLDPPGRSSRWRTDSSAPKNYNDNALYCGGFATQWYSHGGKCGLCGDNYADTPPRANEIGGYYGGVGVITKTYTNTHTIDIEFAITANHVGYIYFNLCNLDESGGIETEDCFEKNRLRFADGSDRFYVGTKTGSIVTTAVLPDNLSCEHCVLRWTYNAGNSWGTCEDGTGAMGCGKQENFKSCADISITAPASRLLKVLGDAADVASPPEL